MKQLFIILGVIIISCKKEKNIDPKNNLIIEHLDGLKLVKKTNKDSLFINHVEVFNTEEQLIKEYTLRYGLKSGLETSYYVSGRKEYEVFYKKDTLENIATWFYDNQLNSIKTKSNYNKGITEGNQFEFYENGNIKTHIGLNPEEKVVYMLKYDDNQNISFEDGNYKIFGTINNDSLKFSSEEKILIENHFANPSHIDLKYHYTFQKSDGQIIWVSPIVKNNKIEIDTFLIQKGKYKFIEKLEVYNNITDSIFFEQDTLSIEIY